MSRFPTIFRSSGPSKTAILAIGLSLAFFLCPGVRAIGAKAADGDFTPIDQLVKGATAPAKAPPQAPPTNPPSAVVTSLPAVTNTTAASPLVATNDTHVLDDKHRLAIGDRLSFRILEDQEDPAESREPKSLIVADSGEVEVPYIGRVPAGNKTCRELALEIKAALEKDYYYQATVILAVDLMTKSRGRIYLVGPVRQPGEQEIPSDESLTLSKAIMRAGGFTDYADKQRVRITRKGKTNAPDKTLTVDVGVVMEKGRTDLDVPLEPGDLILVPERLIRF
jgi:protein involved in polysaccharide export with SLBB domain